MLGKILQYQSIMLLLFFAHVSIANAEAPTIDPADDSKYFGKPENFLFWTPSEKVAGFRNIDRIFPTRNIPADEVVMPLPVSKKDLGLIPIRRAGKTLTLDELFRRQNMAGLLVIKNGRIVYERYGLGNTKDSPWISFSVTKSVVSMLVGAAIKDGYIKSIDEPVTDYLPRLKGSAYDQATIQNIMQMASGAEWNEDYDDPRSDINTANWNTLKLQEKLRQKRVDAAPGEVYNYNTAETNLVGTLLRSAIGNNLATYLTEKIWRPAGMESDANWMLTESGGGEFGGCCISATLRDYGRIGLFALNGGRLANGTEVLPHDWMKKSTTPSKANPEYGNLWWLLANGRYLANGIFGQQIFINPRQRLVIAVQSAREKASSMRDWDWNIAMFAALVKALQY